MLLTDLLYLTPDCLPPTIGAVPAPSWPLVTARLRLRPFEARDLEPLCAIHSDAGVARWLYTEPRSHEETQELLARKIAGSRLAAEGGWLAAAAVLPETDELVADVSLCWASEAHRQGEIGFLVHPAHQGKGYATEAARALLDFAFGGLGLHRVVGRLEARNTASARVLEKLGMRREAHLVENEWVKGEWQSELVYAILAREWRSAAAGGGGRDRGY
jgi:RimJ/RimL family protein N-acetyltransferase